MSSLTQMLQNAAPQSQDLLNVLATTEYAPIALEKNKAYIAELQTQLQDLKRRLYNLHLLTEIQRKEHSSYADSKFKKWGHKVRGSKGEASFAAKAEKEEREFNEAWQKEHDAEKRRDELLTALQIARSEKTTQESDNNRHVAAQAELDQLHDSIFDGPTPELPDEDRLELETKQAKLRLDQSQMAFDKEKAAGEALRRVEGRLKAATVAMEDALHYSRADIVIGGHYADAKKRDGLSQCQLATMESLRHMDEARRQQPAIVMSPDVEIDNGHLVSDVLFDNIFSNMAMHDRIKDGNSQLQRSVMHVSKEIEKQLRRAAAAKAKLTDTMEENGIAKAALQSCRAEAFERVAAGKDVGGGELMPPPYEG